VAAWIRGEEWFGKPGGNPYDAAFGRLSTYFL
jgi:hypothetical protein